MRTLFISILFLLSGALFMSAGIKEKQAINNDQNFVNSVTRIASLHSTFNNMSEAQFATECETISSSIRELKENYPDINAAGGFSQSMDKLVAGNKSVIHGDSCLRNFIGAVFSCFSSCGGVGPRETVKACVAEACANYQACKAGNNR
jgi:hypothetical protein